MYTDLAGKVHKVALKEATATFYKMYFCDVNSRYEAINKYNPSDIIFFCGRVLERLEVRREAY